MNDVVQLRYYGEVSEKTDMELRKMRRTEATTHGHMELRDEQGVRLGRFPIKLVSVERDTDEPAYPLIVAIVASVPQKPPARTSDKIIAKVRKENDRSWRKRPNAERDAEIFRRVMANEHPAAVGADYGISRDRVSDIVKRMR